MFIGFVPIGQALTFLHLSVNGSQQPTDSSITPTYRVYGNSSLMSNGTGALAFAESKALTNATDASPIVVTSNGHGLTSGMVVGISGVVGNTAANGTFTITVIDANTFSLNGSTGNSAYVSGGTWHTSGLYLASITPTTGNGYAQGQFYTVLVIANVGSVATEYEYVFGVI